MKPVIKRLNTKSFKDKVNAYDLHSQDQIEKLQRAFTITNSVKNNIQYIHWNCRGDKFKTIHDLTQEYYNQLNEEFDFMAELNLQHGLSMGNACVEYFRDNVLNDAPYAYQDALVAIRAQLKIYIEMLNDTSKALETFRGDQSKLDDMIAYWSKELDYKLSRMDIV